MKKLSLMAMAILIVTCAVTPHAFADAEGTPLRFAKIIANNMVLQQEKPINIWGWATPGAKVSVTMTQDAALAAKQLPADDTPVATAGENKVTVQYTETNPAKLETQTLSTTAAADGRWQVKFKPAKASFTPTWIIAKSGEEVIAVENLLVGEVWVCAGQSNMAWGNYQRKDREAASADFPGLRYVSWNDSWYKPLDDVRIDIKWSVCSPQTAEGYSAVPYLFASFMHRYLKVPVGVINVARGGTTGQAWCTRDELDSIDNTLMNTILKNYDTETATWDDPEQVKAIMASWQAECDAAKKKFEADKIKYAKDKAEYDKVKAAGGDAAKKARQPREPRLRMPRQPGDPRSGWSPPAGLFNATVIPIRDLGVRGVLYYQGENNVFGCWTRYEYSFPKVPVSFRKAFGDKDLWFGCISQPGWGRFGADPELEAVTGGYAMIRDIQRRALKDDKFADMIATYPAGNSYIHPANKIPVGENASLWALARVYGKPVSYTGPTLNEVINRDGKMHLTFNTDPQNVKAMKKMWLDKGQTPAYWAALPCPYQGEAPILGFTVADKDRRWYPAKAKRAMLDGKNVLTVWSDLCEEPVAVRYGWANWPTGNLVGRGGQPMPTFRTDDWPIPKAVQYDKELAAEYKTIIADMNAKAELQALDRKLRQIQLDLPTIEFELYQSKQGNTPALLKSKTDRMEKIAGEMLDDNWTANQIRGNPEVEAKARAAREAIQALQAEIKKMQEKK